MIVVEEECGPAEAGERVAACVDGRTRAEVAPDIEEAGREQEKGGISSEREL